MKIMRRYAFGRTLLLTVIVVIASTGKTQGQIEGEAIPGNPFGVARVNVPLTGAEANLGWQTGGFLVRERQGRALYPVFTQGRFVRLLSGLVGSGDQQTPNSVNVYFLFKGDGPLDLTLFTPAAQRLELQPRPPRNPRAFNNLLNRWWREYNAAVREQAQQSDYPPLVENYLTTMLARRIGLEPPLLSRISQDSVSEPLESLELLMGVEKLRMEMLRETVSSGRVNVEVANQPPPAGVSWTPLEPPIPDGDVAIESIAMRVPHECFYVRFGSFENYLWIDKLQKDYGGDISRMVTLRGYNARLTERMQQQLGLKQSALAGLLGPSVIADVALIGRDLFLREGAAVGILFEAKLPVLSVDLEKQRAEALAREKAAGATLEKVEIAGREVSFLSTPDNRLRSYYAADGAFHFVTTSRVLMERFFEVRDGAGSLGASGEFRHARSVMPVEREDTIFAYFSSAFFEGLFSPQYQIELRRRLRAVTDIELVRLAKLAAEAERQPSGTLDELTAGGFLPHGFGLRPDGSGPILAGDQVINSLRGRRGSFTPIPDVKIISVTSSEAAKFGDQSRFYGGQWQQFDPLVFGVKRFALNEQGLERVVIDAFVTPFSESKYGWITSILGPPATSRVSPVPGDIITMQAVVKGGLLSPTVPPHHLFLGIQDNEPVTDLKPDGLLKTLQIIQTTPGYLGAWPKPGFLDWLPFGLGGGPPDANGYSQLLFGIWRRQWGAFSALSLDPSLLAYATPHLQIEDTDDDAQIRVHVGDLSRAKLRTLVNRLAFARAHQASIGNARFLHTLSQQLNVPRESAKATAEDLLDAELTCTLGGDYELLANQAGDELWISSAWGNEQYHAPLLEWFRGLDAGLTKYGDRVVVRATIDMQRKPSERPKMQLPFFDLFGGSKPEKKESGEPGEPARPVPEPPEKKPAPREF